MRFLYTTTGFVKRQARYVARRRSELCSPNSSEPSSSEAKFVVVVAAAAVDIEYTLLLASFFTQSFTSKARTRC